MANIQSFQVQNDTPVSSHGMGSDVKVARFQVTLPITANLDTIEFGRLPDYAVPIEAMLHTTGVLVADVGITGDGDGFFDGVTTVANVPLRSALSTLIGKNVGLGGAAVTGLCNGAGTAGTCNLIIHYVVEDAGVAYPFVDATP
jgi:hypothetical protein